MSSQPGSLASGTWLHQQPAKAEGNSYQQRPLDDGSTHEVLKNFPTPEQAIAALGPRARDVQWLTHTHYWVLKYSLR